jgi:hypothetical protein
MDNFTAKEIIKNIMRRDYNRWIRYVDKCIKKRDSYTESFYSWKEKHNMIEEDAKALADILCP